MSIKAVAEEKQVDAVESIDTRQFSSKESVGTNLGDLFKKLGL